MSKIAEIAAAIEAGKAKSVAGLVEAALAEGIDPAEILNGGMIAAMERIGEKFTANEIFVPEMLISARAMKKGVEVLGPHLTQAGVEPLGKIIIGTVSGDLHDIGKNLVAMMLEGAGFAVVDLGVDVSPAAYVEAVQANPDADIVALSSLLTTTLPMMQATIEALAAAGLRENVKVMVGGAPVTEAFARQIGADGYSEDAAAAAALARRLLGK